MAEKRITDLELATSFDGALVEVSQPSATVRIAAATISAAASDNSFNDSAGGFLAAGFALGDRVGVKGFATGANNLFVGVVTAIDADKMTIGGEDGDPLLDEAAGAAIVIAKWTSKRAPFNPSESIIVAVGDEETELTSGAGKVKFRMPYAFTLLAVRASLTTASSSGTPTVDINEGGASILSTKLTIDSGETTSKTAAAAAVISDANLADDAEITIDVDSAGTDAVGLKVYLIGVKA